MCSRDATMNRSLRIVSLSCLHGKKLLSTFNKMGSIRKTNVNNLKHELGIMQKVMEQRSYPMAYLGDKISAHSSCLL